MKPGDQQDDFMDQFVAEQAMVYAFVRSLVPNYADAEELFQQVALTMWRKRDSFDPQLGPFRAWAIGIARNHIRNFDRRQARDHRVQMYAPDVIDRIAACWQEEFDEFWQERQVALRNCIGKLRSADRLTLENHYLGGVKAEEAARSAGISRRSHYRKIGKIKRLLLDCITKTMELGRGADGRY